MLEKALETAREGYPVFPLWQGKKTPIHDGGFKIATRDEDQIRAWWTQNPLANIGVPTGQVSGISVVDIDGHQGIQSIRQTFGSLPETRIQETPHGNHLVYKYDPLFNNRNAVLPNVDLKSDGGYLVWAGSLVDCDKPDRCTDHYPEYKVSRARQIISIGQVPEVFQKGNKHAKNLVTSDGSVPEGKRNDTFIRLAGGLRKAGLSAETIRLALLQHNQEVCVPPLPEEEVEGIANQAGGWVQGEIEEDENPIESAYTRMNFLKPSDWIDEPIEEDTWLVEDIVPDDSLVMVTAFAKGGKSTFTRHLGVAVARGETFLGKKVRQGKVLYLAVEETHKKVKQNFRRLGITADDDLLLKFGKPDKHAVDDLRLICEQEKPVLVIVDTVTRMPKASFEMNDYFANSEWLDPYMYMAHELGIVIIVNYHSSRNGRKLEGIEAIASPLGSTGILATPDQFINIFHESDNSRSISTVGRYDPVPPTLLAFDKETQRLTAVGEKSEVEKQQLRVSIVEGLTDEWSKQRDILEGVQGNAKKKLEALGDLVAEGQVERQGEGRKNSPYEIRKTFLFSVPTLKGEQETESLEPEPDKPKVKEPALIKEWS